jgi:predicted PurR-regulated permease PerM
VRSPLTRERERVTTIFFYGVVLLLGYLFLRILTPFFAPLGWAFVLAVCIYPWHEKLVPRYRNAGAAALSTLLVTVLIVGPGLVVLTAFAQESRAALSTVDQDAFAGQLASLEGAWNPIRGLIPGAQSVDLRSLLDDVVSRTGGFLAARVGGLLADLVVVLFQLFVTLFALFFFLRDADTIMYEVRRSLPFEEFRRERMIRQTRDLVYASIAAGLVIAALQGLAGGSFSPSLVSRPQCSGVS